MPRSSRYLLYGMVWFATFFRLKALFQNHFHADEALFASWARLIAVWRDPLLLTQPVDKPPLLFYLQGLFFPLFGKMEWAARMPDFWASILLIPLVAALAWRLYKHPAIPVLAALFVTMSPMAIQFSATAFTDPLLVTFIIAALIAAADKPKPVISGLFFGLAVLTKYQAFLFLPLLAGIAWLNSWRWTAWKRWLMGFLPLMALFISWTLIRADSPEIWRTQIVNFGGFRLAWSWELLPRLFAWSKLGNAIWGSPLLSISFVLLLIVLLISSRRRSNRSTIVDKLLILFTIGYLLLHWFVAIPVWDRYLLPLLPIFAILMARGLIILYSFLSSVMLANRLQTWGAWKFTPYILLALLFLILLPSAISARHGSWPVGGQTTADQGAWQVAGYLDDKPYGTVLYDHWFNWYWQYHLFDRGVYVSWFAHPAALVEDLSVFASGPGQRYIVLPADQRAQPVIRALIDAGITLEQEMQTDYNPGMNLYRIQQVEDGQGA